MIDLTGWISLHRKIQEHWLWEERPFSKGQAWIDILLLVNHEDGKVFMDGELIEVYRGEHITSEPKLAARWGWSRTKVRNFLDLLEKEGMIKNIKEGRKRTRLRVLNYNVYQDNLNNRKTTEEQEKDNRKTTEEQQKNINNNDNNVIKNITTTIIDETPDTRNDNLVAQVGAGPTKQISPVEEIERTYLQIRNRPMCSSKDMIDIVNVYEKYKDIDFILGVMKTTAEENKARNGRITINSFSYFMPIFQDEWNKRKGREKGDRHGPVSGNGRKNFKFDKSKLLWNGGENSP